MIDLRTMTPKTADAVDIRDTIMAAIDDGVFDVVFADDAIVHCNGGGFTIFYRKEVPVITKMTNTLAPYAFPHPHPYGLDVWPDGQNCTPSAPMRRN